MAPLSRLHVITTITCLKLNSKSDVKGALKEVSNGHLIVQHGTTVSPFANLSSNGVPGVRTDLAYLGRVIAIMQGKTEVASAY